MVLKCSDCIPDTGETEFLSKPNIRNDIPFIYDYLHNYE